MLIKSKLRSLLRDLIVTSPVEHHKDRILNRQTIKNIILDSDDLSGKLREQSQGGLIRILAQDDDNANQIAARLEKHKEELSISSTHIASKALDYSPPPKRELSYERSVIIKLKLRSLINSATSILFDNHDSLRRDILECGESGSGETEHVVIDFSSPNIAKPFHFGHLKSTILGNYLANINKFLGNKVTKLNYIGDWGTQYGLLSLGLEQFSDKISGSAGQGSSPLRELLDIYVKANEQGRVDESFYEEAKRRFLLMDTEIETDQLSKWRTIKQLTMDELKRSYLRLGVEFDEFEFESDYAREAAPIVNRILEKKFARRLEDGVVVAQVEKKNRILEVPVLRSDGASLYLSRDIAAAISRKKRFNFDKMLYVVGTDQERHFHCVKELVKSLGYEWSEQLFHVKMGKVLGMSTRSGNFELLSDIIDEATRKYIESTENTPTTRTATKDEVESVGHNLALSALFVYDMRNGRTRHYEFNWDQMVMDTNRSGINLQTTHARLSSLLSRAAEFDLHPFESVDELEPNALCCEEAMNLLSNLDELDNVLHASFWSMDPSYLVNHAIKLCRAINRARQSERLWVLGESNGEWAQTRLTLFACARFQLGLMIRLIGLKPLDRV